MSDDDRIGFPAYKPLGRFESPAASPIHLACAVKNRDTGTPPDSPNNPPEEIDGEHPNDPESPGARNNDNMVDRPISVPLHPSSQTMTAVVDTIVSQVDKECLLIQSNLMTPSFFQSTRWRLGIVFVCSLLMLYVLSQTLQIIRNILEMPSATMWIAVSLLTALLGFILYVLVLATRFFSRLSSATQLDIKQLKNCENYAGLRPYRIAKEECLVPYLEDLVQSAPVNLDRLRTLEGGAAVLDAAKRMLNNQERLNSREWVEDFREHVQAPMIKIAKYRINHYARLVAVKTAISPWPLVDIAAVCYNAIQMLNDLACIFGRRFSRPDSLRLMIRIFLNVYIAGETQEALTTIQQAVGKRLGPAGAGGEDQVFNSIFGDAAQSLANLAKASAKKVGEGVVNGLLMRRLGNRAVDMLKYMR
jgi:uncharacterized membrane protein YcjF (UPF0283 family)